MRIEKCAEDNRGKETVCVDVDTVRAIDGDNEAVGNLIQVLNAVTAKLSPDRQRPPCKPGRRPIHCETCQFWEADECRRYPPAIHGELSKHDKISVCSGHFPLTSSDEWCGEWQERDESVETKRGDPAVTKQGYRQGESNEPT